MGFVQATILLIVYGHFPAMSRVILFNSRYPCRFAQAIFLSLLIWYSLSLRYRSYIACAPNDVRNTQRHLFSAF